MDTTHDTLQRTINTLLVLLACYINTNTYLDNPTQYSDS